MLCENRPVNLVPCLLCVGEALQSGTMRHFRPKLVRPTRDALASSFLVQSVSVPSGNVSSAVIGSYFLYITLADGSELERFVHLGSIPYLCNA